MSPPTPSTPVIKTECPDEDYDVDIKEKLKEMGEITFASVKKGDKTKKTDVTTGIKQNKNQFVILKSSEFYKHIEGHKIK